MPQAATIKQAKAAYKTRAEQPLTEREKKQLERSIQLDRRAWGLREREKNKLDLVKKRAAQEKAQKDEERRIGTQRRNDKFGFKSSQLHLGAFFRKPGPAPLADSKDRKVGVANEQPDVFQPATTTTPEVEMNVDKGQAEDLDDESSDEFEGVDDESLLEALQSPEAMRVNPVSPDVQARSTMSMPPPPRPAFVKPPNKATAQPPVQEAEDLEWQDFLESSTQIAREISTESSAIQPPPAHVPAPNEDPRVGSFSSGSFEFTEDDIEQLDPTPCPRVQRGNTPEQTKAASERMAMPPPPLPVKRWAQGREKKGLREDLDPKFVVDPIHAQDELGFSMTQLESFVDDDLQLTQAE
ncbi:hypothetical protein Q7P35_005904 [Cladosporium inversicolor]